MKQSAAVLVSLIVSAAPLPGQQAGGSATSAGTRAEGWVFLAVRFWEGQGARLPEAVLKLTDR